MHKISHTALPPERMTNNIKPGGLWHGDEGERLVREAARIVSQPRKVKDQFVTFARWFWAITALGTVITFFIIHANQA